MPTNSEFLPRSALPGLAPPGLAPPWLARAPTSRCSRIWLVPGHLFSLHRSCAHTRPCSPSICCRSRPSSAWLPRSVVPAPKREPRCSVPVQTCHRLLLESSPAAQRRAPADCLLLSKALEPVLREVPPHAPSPASGSSPSRLCPYSSFFLLHVSAVFLPGAISALPDSCCVHRGEHFAHLPAGDEHPPPSLRAPHASFDLLLSGSRARCPSAPAALGPLSSQLPALPQVDVALTPPIHASPPRGARWQGAQPRPSLQHSAHLRGTRGERPHALPGRSVAKSSRAPDHAPPRSPGGRPGALPLRQHTLQTLPPAPSEPLVLHAASACIGPAHRSILCGVLGVPHELRPPAAQPVRPRPWLSSERALTGRQQLLLHPGLLQLALPLPQSPLDRPARPEQQASAP
mmetsp:Transcript_52058/g.112810  ORF Transcript_52058/g.112810 Transcript_52058/m.112810 type:complete len:403 (+) Transcript_52058:2-1210(+)